MTLEKIANELTNGLHDAKILSIHHDYENALVTLRIEFPGSLSDPACRRGEILFRRVLYCAIELPEVESSFLHPGSLWITSFEAVSERLPKKLIAALPPDTLHYSIFNRDWLSETHIAAADCDFRWIET